MPSLGNLKENKVATLVDQLNNPAYHQGIKLRGYNGQITVFQAVNDRDAAKVLKRLKPQWSKPEHADLAKAHEDEAQAQRAEWNRLLDEAAMATFGRPFQFHDYRISAIGREEFSEEHKKKLRFAAHAVTYHTLAARAHAKAARGR